MGIAVERRRWSWRQRDLVMWDNRSVLYRATLYDSVNYNRMLQRTTVSGDAEEYGRERARYEVAA